MTEQMIGKLYSAITPYYDRINSKISFKSRPILILAKADQYDFVVLPISTITIKPNINPTYDIQVVPQSYPKLNLTKVSYIRTHKQIIVNKAHINNSNPISDLKKEYEQLYLKVLMYREEFNQYITTQALS